MARRLRQRFPWYSAGRTDERLSYGPDNFGFCVIDRFLVIAPAPKRDKPTHKQIENLAEVLCALRAEYTLLLDFTKPGIVYEEYAALIDQIGVSNIQVLTSPESFASALRLPFYDARYLHLNRVSLPFRYTHVSAMLFGDHLDLDSSFGLRHDQPNLGEKLWDDYVEKPLPDEKQVDLLKGDIALARKIERYGWDRYQVGRWRLLRSIFQQRAVNSLLGEYVFQANGTGITVSPFHSHATFDVRTEHSLVAAQPAVLARHTGTLLARQLNEFNQILGNPDVKERDIQRWIEHHPQILLNLGYRRLVPHVVLERNDGTSLIPDFFVQPLTSDWWDILDLKLPRKQLIAGSRDRHRLSAGVHELAAQLREYAAYFEDVRAASRVEQLFGVKCYRPKLIGVFGSDADLAEDDRERRRLMTAYSDLQVLTFDSLVRAAQSRILI